MASKLNRRVKIAQMAVDKYKDKSFSFKDNRDCGMMALFVLTKLGVAPHKRKDFGNYTTAKGAKKALARLGYDNLIDLMDKHFERITPAMCLPGDIVAIPSEDDAIGALAISLGNGAVLTYHEEHEGAVTGSLESATAAWRSIPL